MTSYCCALPQFCDWIYRWHLDLVLLMALGLGTVVVLCLGALAIVWWAWAAPSGFEMR